MSEKRPSLYIGTPLNKTCDDDGISASNNHDGPITSRRIRLNQQQYVRDEQGRRRFHGAFTGGFSAGYYNSVDTAQGFRPKSFVSHRKDKRDGRPASDANLGQKPEDFMDEEDLGEFGIAPRKIRLVGDFESELSGSKASKDSGSRLQCHLTPRSESIGEEILRRMTGRRLRKEDSSIKNRSAPKKNDLHGLGYKPLSIPFSATSSKLSNPLNAVMKDGKLLKISGQAFGAGVLNDDEDHIEDADEYGYDDIANYDFESKAKTVHRSSKTSQATDHEVSGNPGDSINVIKVRGFVLEESKDLTAKSHDDILKKYAMPVVEPGWQMPTRSEPYIPPRSIQETKEQELSWQKAQQSADLFSSKFTSSTSKLVSLDKNEQKSGLLSYSDLKAAEDLKSKLNEAKEAKQSKSISEPAASIVRSVFEWRPCSLLCKHFNVPNPFPDNAFFGLKSNSPEGTSDNSRNYGTKANKEDEFHQEQVSIEYLRSIFNAIVEIEEHVSDRDDPDSYQIVGEANEISEDEPQILEHRDDGHVLAGKQDGDSDNDSDIVVMSVPKPEPEVIVLSSSSLSTSSRSSSSSSSKSSMSAGDRVKKSSGGRIESGLDSIERDNDLDDDAYGPPLPPTRQTLLSAKHHSKSGKSSRRKRKKEKKSKRRKRHKATR